MSDRDREIYQEMHDELESFQLITILVPAPDPQHEGHMIRANISVNPAWYRRLCAKYPSTRPGKIRTKIKLRHVLSILLKLAQGKPVDSYLVPSLEVEAEAMLNPSEFTIYGRRVA